MKILNLKGYKWLLSQNQRVRNDFFDYRQDGYAYQIFFKKALKQKDVSAQANNKYMIASTQITSIDIFS